MKLKKEIPSVNKNLRKFNEMQKINQKLALFELYDF